MDVTLANPDLGRVERMGEERLRNEAERSTVGQGVDRGRSGLIKWMSS